MIRRIFREYYLLPRGEQRALLLLSLLVVLTLGARMAVRKMPVREPGNMDQFQEEAMGILSALAEADSLKEALRFKASYKAPYAPYNAPFVANGAQVEANFLASPIELNKADSIALLALPGIGPVFAGRIVKYRALLGGFCKVEQLSEIYGMKQETLELVTPLVVLDITGLEKLPINNSGFRELLRHPYLEYKDVKALVHYMDTEGGIASVEDIRLNCLLADSTLERMAPYIDFTF